MKNWKNIKWFVILIITFVGLNSVVSCDNKDDDVFSSGLDNPFTNEGDIPEIEDDQNSEKELKEVSKSISDLKELYDGEDIPLEKDNDSIVLTTSGIIISDPGSGNQPEGILVIQSGESGISLKLNTSSDILSYKSGDFIKVSLGAGVLIQKDGNFMIKGLDAADDISVEEREKEATVNKITLKELYDNFEKYNNTLVTVENVKLDPNPDYGTELKGNHSLDDGTGSSGSIELHTESSAAYADEFFPSSSHGQVNYDLTGVLFNGENDNKQIWSRNKSDIISYLPVETPIIITGFLANPAGADQPEPGHKSWDWHHPDNAGFEYIQLMALEDIDFSQTPYSVVVSNNFDVTEKGWAETGEDEQKFRSFKFNLTEGTAAKGTFFYVGSDSKIIDGYQKGDTWQDAYSTDISEANWVRTIVVNDGSAKNSPPNIVGDGFGYATAGLMHNVDKKGNPDGIAVFEGTDISPSSIPLDALFFNPGPNNKENPPFGTALKGSFGYQLPNSDLYYRTNPETGEEQHLFGQGTNVAIIPDAGESDHWATVGGIITDRGWIKPRQLGTKKLNNNSQLSDIESGNGVIKYQ